MQETTVDTSAEIEYTFSGSSNYVTKEDMNQILIYIDNK